MDHSLLSPAPYAEIHSLAEDIEAHPGSGYPCGSYTRMWQAIDQLRDAGCPAPKIDHAKKIAVAMAHLQVALRQPEPQRAVAARLAKAYVGKLGREWLQDLPMELSRQ